MNHNNIARRTAVAVLLVFFNLPNLCLASDDSSKTNLLNTDKDSLKNSFFNQHDFSDLYLAFAGPYPSSPTSSFGHVFALLKPTNSKPFLLWDVVEFSADLDEYTSMDFFLKGIFSTLNGYYRILPFSDKLREYTFLESRSIWLFHVETNRSERLAFLDELYQLEGKALPYRFSNLNCASEIYKIINSSKINSFGNINSFLILPKDVIEKFQTDSCIVIRAVEEKLKTLRNNTYQSKDDSLSVSKEKEKLLVLERIYASRKEHLNENEYQELKQLRQRVLSESESDFVSLNRYETEFSMHPTIFVSAGLQNSKLGNHATFGYRFGLHNFFDIYDVYPKYDYLSIFDLEIAFNSSNFSLNKLMIFDQSSQTPFSSFIKKPTWGIAFGSKRKNEFATRDLAIGAFLNYGLSLPLLSDASTLSIKAHAEPVYLISKGFYVIAGAEATAKVSIGDFFRLKINFRESVKNIEDFDHIWLLENQLCFNFSKNFSTHLNTTTNSLGTEISLKFLYYVK